MFSLGKLRLKQQLGVLIGIALIMTAGTQLFFYFRFQTLTRERAERYVESMVNQVAGLLLTNARNTEHGASTIAYNRHVQEYLTSIDPGRKYVILLPFVLDVLEYVRASNENIYDIIIAGTEGRTISSLQGEYNYHQDIQRALIQDYRINEMEFRTPVHTALLQNIDGAFYYAYILPIFSAHEKAPRFEKIGSCIVVSNTESLGKALLDVAASPNSNFLILDSDNTIIAGNNRETQGKAFEEIYPFTMDGIMQGGILRGGNGRTMVQHRLIQDSGWKVVSLIPERELSEDMRSIRSFGLLLGFLMILALISAAMVLIRSITQPVSKLLGFIEKAGEGSARLEMPAPNEVGIIAGYINRMLDKIEEDTEKLLETQKQVYEVELLKKQAELAALQNQINPHFLYNTLNCISSIALINDLTEIVTISEAMVRIFRYSIQQSELVSVRDEIQCISDYMEIMNIRYPRRFSFQTVIDEAILKLKTPKMILQPLVENAVYHGLEAKNGSGVLAVSGSLLSGGTVQILIEDDGKGMGKEELEKLRRSLASENPREDAAGTNRSIGLTNINHRIRLMFGGEYGVKIESVKNKGTKVRLLLPVLD